MESDLKYSKEALEAKAAFYSKDYTIYVEGKDDLLFWDNVCKQANLKNYHLEDVGGEPINDYKKILNTTGGDFLVACDLNFDQIITRKHSQKIIYTYGHSIENSMYVDIDKIDGVIKKYSKNLRSSKSEIVTAYENLLSKLTDLIIYDIANSIYNKPHIVLTNSCNRFLLVDHSYHLCEKKINNLIVKLSRFFSKEEIDYCKKMVAKFKKEIWFYIRGHFITTWVYKLIKTIAEKLGSSIYLSYDAMYSEFVYCDYRQFDIKPLIKNLKKGVNGIYIM